MSRPLLSPMWTLRLCNVPSGLHKGALKGRCLWVRRATIFAQVGGSSFFLAHTSLHWLASSAPLLGLSAKLNKASWSLFVINGRPCGGSAGDGTSWEDDGAVAWSCEGEAIVSHKDANSSLRDERDSPCVRECCKILSHMLQCKLNRYSSRSRGHIKRLLAIFPLTTLSASFRLEAFLEDIFYEIPSP